MKKLFVLISILFVSVISYAQKDKPYLEKSFTNEAIKSVQVSTSGGSIKLNGGAVTTKVKVFVRSNNLKTFWNDEEIAEKLKEYTIEVKIVNETLICNAKSNNNRNKNLMISFEIDCPTNVNTRLVTSGGSINLSQLNGDINFKTSGGSLNLSNLSGNINGHTSGGSIKSEGLRNKVNLSTSGGSITVLNSSGELQLNTSGGSMTFENISGRLEAKTSGGSIKLNNVQGDVKISTSGGSIKFTDSSGNLTANTSAGSISGNILSIRESVNLQTSAGMVKVDLPFGEGLDLDLKGSRIHSEKLENFSNTLKEGRVSGKVNGGGKTVKIHTSVGSIYVD